MALVSGVLASITKLNPLSLHMGSNNCLFPLNTITDTWKPGIVVFLRVIQPGVYIILLPHQLTIHNIAEA